MSLLLKICEGSSVKHSITDSDIELALNFEINDFSDNIFMSDGWSMNSLGAEVCLHIARRLKPGEIAREELVKKGIYLSSIADSRVKASNGLVKHILAYQAHRAVYLDLLGLAGLDAKTPRKNIYDMVMDTTNRSRRRSTLMNRPTDTNNNSLDNSGTDRDIVRRLVLKEPPAATSSGAAVGSSSGESKGVESFEKTKNPRKNHISERLFYRDPSSSSANLSGSGVSFGSAEKIRPLSKVSLGSLPSIASDKSASK